MKKNVEPVRGAEAELPETVSALKFPSELESVQEDAPFVFQKMLVREPTATDAGTAQMSTFGGLVGTVLDAIAPAFACALADGRAGVDAPGSTPTRSPLEEQRLSKREVGMP